jgi:tetratricopeptide (TPR) repeat protein
VLQLVLALLFAATTVAPAQSPSQNPAQKPSQPTPQNPEQPQPAASATARVPEEVILAEDAMAKSDWKTAETKLDPWLAAHPTDARALFDAGYVADAENRLDQADALYRRATEADPNSFEAHLSLGLLLAREVSATPNAANPNSKDNAAKLAEARAELALATNLDPGESGPALKARAWRALAQIDRASDPTQASNDLMEALKLTPETTDDTLLAANLADQAGEPAAAEAAFRRVLAHDAKSAAANAGLAHLLIAQKKYPEAETFLRAALEQAPDDPALTAQLATVLAIQDKAEALPLVQKLHDAHPNDAAITLMLAEILSDAGDFAGSDHYYAALLAASPKDAALLVGHGQNLIRLLRYADAFAAFSKATQLDSANADGWSGLAFAASRTSQPAVTIHALTMRSKYLPEIPSTYFLWATSYDTLHQKTQAVAYYHHFLDAAAGKFPDQEWQARQRLVLLEK